MKDKIVYICSNIPDKTPAGVRAFANSLALQDYGYNVKIISKDIECQKEFDINEGMDTWHFRRARSIKEWISALIDVKPYIKIIDDISDVKVVIAYELPSVAFLRLQKYCKRNNIKLICEAAEWQKWENLGYLGIIARTVRLLDINLSMHYAYKKSNGLILSSNYFSSKFKGRLPTLVLPTLQCYRLNTAMRERVNPIRRFIYAGGLGFKKDMLCEVIHSFSHVSERPFEFIILGLTKSQYIERFPEDIDIIKSINQNEEKIKFRGKVSHNEALNEICKSDFAIIIRENTHRNNIGFPTKYGESINCGTPVVVSDFSDVPYYTKKFGVGIITKFSNIIQGIKEALEMDDASLVEMRERCRNCTAFYYKGHVNELGDFIKGIIIN